MSTENLKIISDAKTACPALARSRSVLPWPDWGRDLAARAGLRNPATSSQRFCQVVSVIGIVAACLAEQEERRGNHRGAAQMKMGLLNSGEQP